MVLTNEKFFTDDDLEEMMKEWEAVRHEEFNEGKPPSYYRFHEYLIDVKGFKHIEYTASIFDDN